jgi:hypothetical protein
MAVIYPDTAARWMPGSSPGMTVCGGGKDGVAFSIPLIPAKAGIQIHSE